MGLRQKQLVFEHFAVDGEVPVGVPFFPTPSGKAVDKRRVVLLVEMAAGQLGIVIIGPDGRPAFGGHVFRISGSRHLARNALEVAIVKLLARWDSEIVFGYIKDTPLEAITATYQIQGCTHP